MRTVRSTNRPPKCLHLLMFAFPTLAEHGGGGNSLQYSKGKTENGDHCNMIPTARVGRQVTEDISSKKGVVDRCSRCSGFTCCQYCKVGVAVVASVHLAFLGA